MELIDKQALQEKLKDKIGIFPAAIRRAIDEAPVVPIVDNIFGELESVMNIVKYPRTLPNGKIRVETIRGYMIMREDYETIKKKYRDMIRGENADEYK